MERSPLGRPETVISHDFQALNEHRFSDHAVYEPRLPACPLCASDTIDQLYEITRYAPPFA
jgi:hypothetical protein